MVASARLTPEFFETTAGEVVGGLRTDPPLRLGVVVGVATGVATAVGVAVSVVVLELSVVDAHVSTASQLGRQL